MNLFTWFDIDEDSCLEFTQFDIDKDKLVIYAIEIEETDERYCFRTLRNLKDFCFKNFIWFGNDYVKNYETHTMVNYDDSSQIDKKCEVHAYHGTRETPFRDDV